MTAASPNPVSHAFGITAVARLDAAALDPLSLAFERHIQGIWTKFLDGGWMADVAPSILSLDEHRLELTRDPRVRSLLLRWISGSDDEIIAQIKSAMAERLARHGDTHRLESSARVPHASHKSGGTRPVLFVHGDSRNGIRIDSESGRRRFTYAPPNTRVWCQRDKVRFTTLLGEILDAMAEVEAGAAKLVLASVTEILLRSPLNAGYASSSSWRGQCGRVGLLLHPGALSEPPRIAQALLHEAVHSCLYMLEAIEPVFLAGSDPQNGNFISPWTGRSLPAHSFAHSIVVWAALGHFSQAACDRGAPAFKKASVDLLETVFRGFRESELHRQLEHLAEFVTPAALQELATVAQHFRTEMSMDMTSTPTRQQSPGAKPEVFRPLGQERVEVVYDRTRRSDIVFRNAWLPNYQARQAKAKWLLTSPVGTWDLVDEDLFERLKSVALPVDEFLRLENSFLILTKGNTERYFDAYQKWTTPHFRHPTHHIIVTTLRCNLACSYCHADVIPASASKSNDLSPDTMDRIITFALNSNAEQHSFEFQGGESLLNSATLRHAILEIRRRYAEMERPVYISIQSNSTLLTDEWWAFFKAHNVRVGTSLDGTADVHDGQRTTTSGRPTHALVSRRIQKYGLASLPTITAQSAPHWQDLIDQQLAAGHTTIYFQNVYPINNAKKNWAKVGLEMDDYLAYYGEVAEYVRSLWRPNFYPLERRCYLALRKLIQGRDLDFADFGSPCGMAHSQIVYHTNGDIYTCDEGRDFPEFKLGNVFTSPYEEVLFGQRIQELKSLSIPNDPPCGQCAYRPYCSTCPVYDRAATGRLQSTHAGTDKCRQTKNIYDRIFSWICQDEDQVMEAARYHGIC